MASLSPKSPEKSPEQSEKSKKYDRQIRPIRCGMNGGLNDSGNNSTWQSCNLFIWRSWEIVGSYHPHGTFLIARLWGNHGQFELENASVCLINVTVLGTEILKSLVLPGIGSFTIVGSGVITDADVGSNFFLNAENVGKPKAEVAARLLLELNPDVHGDFVDESAHQVLENNPSYFNNFSIVIGSSLTEKEMCALSTTLWAAQVPLLVCRSYGFAGVARLQLAEHTVVESRPDNRNPDLRICHPFATLSALFDAYDLDAMDTVERAHVPYPVILRKCFEKFGKIPRTYAEKEQFRDLIRSCMEKECENFQEAVRAVNFAIRDPIVPAEIEKILNDNETINLTTKSKSFWILARSLKEFVEKEKFLPVRGQIPDMTAETKQYIKLQMTYRERAQKDADVVYRRAQELLRELDQPADAIAEKDAHTFCQNADCLRVIRGTAISDEYMNKSYDVSFIGSMLEDPDSLMDVYIILRSIERFYTEYNDYPGVYDDQVEPDILKLKACVTKLLSDIGCGCLIKDDVIHEFCRYGSAELHSVSAFLGGCLAQEVIKIVTKQYAPFNNTFVYNAISSTTTTFVV